MELLVVPRAVERDVAPGAPLVGRPAALRAHKLLPALVLRVGGHVVGCARLAHPGRLVIHRPWRLKQRVRVCTQALTCVRRTLCTTSSEKKTEPSVDVTTRA